MADSPFPADVVERAEAAFDVESVEDRRALHRALSVIADYLKSEEAQRIAVEAMAANNRSGLTGRWRAAIAALLGRKE